MGSVSRHDWHSFRKFHHTPNFTPKYSMVSLIFMDRAGVVIEFVAMALTMAVQLSKSLSQNEF